MFTLLGRIFTKPKVSMRRERRFLVQRSTKYYITVSAILASAWMIQAQYTGSRINKWTPTADMAAPRSAACSVRMADGRVLVAGGNGASGAVSTVELYGADGTFTAGASMSESRANAGCVLLQDGRVAVTGGMSGDTKLASVEIYDPSGDAWTS